MDEMAKELKVSKPTLRKWMKEGCPYLQAEPNSKVFFIPEKVYKWLERNFERIEEKEKDSRLRPASD